MSSFDIFFDLGKIKYFSVRVSLSLSDLCHQHLAKRFKVCPQLLLSCFPRQTQHNEVGALALVLPLVLVGLGPGPGLLSRPPPVNSLEVPGLRGDADKHEAAPSGVHGLEELALGQPHAAPGPGLGVTELEAAGPGELG